MPIRGSGFDLDIIPTGMRHAGIAQATEEELAVEDEFLISQAVAEMNVGGTFRFLGTDDTQPEGIVEAAHYVRAIFPLLSLGFAVHVGEIVGVIQHRIGGL